MMYQENDIFRQIVRARVPKLVVVVVAEDEANRGGFFKSFLRCNSYQILSAVVV